MIRRREFITLRIGVLSGGAYSELETESGESY